MSIRKVSDQDGIPVEGDVNETHQKCIGYLAPRYYDLWLHGCSEEPTEFTSFFDEARETARDIEQPCWPVKYAAIYYTYAGKCYSTDSCRMDCTQEVFGRMANTLIDRMYQLGAYDMFYSGMMD